MNAGRGNGQVPVPESPGDGGGGDLEREVARVLRDYPRIFFACHTRHVRDPVEGGEVSQHQSSILHHLDEVDPTSVGELADHMGVTPSTMSLSVKRLVRQGHVARSRDPEDGRVVHLRLTESGRRIVEADSVLEPRLVEAMLAGMDSPERDAALDGLTLLAGAADRLVREGRPVRDHDDERRRA